MPSSQEKETWARRHTGKCHAKTEAETGVTRLRVEERQARSPPQKLEQQEPSEQQGPGHTHSHPRPRAAGPTAWHAPLPGGPGLRPSASSHAPGGQAPNRPMRRPSMLAEDRSRPPLCPLTCSCHPPRARPPRLHCRWHWSRCPGGLPRPWLWELCPRGHRPLSSPP